MAYKTDNRTTATRRVRRRSVVATPAPSPVHVGPGTAEPDISPATAHNTTLLFQVVLAAATCLTLIGAVATLGGGGQAVPSSSPDAPPPAVFVQTD